MGDPIRNLKIILSGGSKSTSSDEETQPLVSSSYSSSASTFGSIIFNNDAGFANSETSDDNENPQKHETKDEFNCLTSSQKVELLTPFLHSDNQYDHQFWMDLEPPQVYNTEEFLYGNQDKRRNHYFNDDTLSVQKASSANVFNTPLTPHSGIDGFSEIMDCKEVKKKPTNNSLVTIFAIWNTTMGSSLLAMSWGIQMAGLFPGITINILVAAVCLYTCYLLLKITDKHGLPGQDTEVHHLCYDLLGLWAQILAKIFSIVVLFGANVVYTILMSNFLYNSVYFFYNVISEPSDMVHSNVTVLCPKEFALNSTFITNVTNATLTETHPNTIFDKIWNLYSTVPLYLAVIMFSVLNFKSPTFFTKFNSLGTISVVYLLVFVAVKSYNWGINMTNWQSEIYVKPTFSALSGMLSMSYFIHSIIISVMRNNKNQRHNGRDLSIAFGLITFTYLFIGVSIYITFPLAKSCIEDNILNNFRKNDTLTVILRILLLFQLFTVFPLISFMLRNDILGSVNQIFRNSRFGDFTYGRVMALNGCLLFIYIMFACFLPKIGMLIRYTGAMSGMVYIFMLPNLLQLASLRKEHKLTVLRTFWHLSIIVIGALNLLSQFFISE